MGIPKRKIICFVNTKIASIALAILAQNAIAAGGLEIVEVTITAHKYGIDTAYHDEQKVCNI